MGNYVTLEEREEPPFGRAVLRCGARSFVLRWRAMRERTRSRIRALRDYGIGSFGCVTSRTALSKDGSMLWDEQRRTDLLSEIPFRIPE